MYYYKINVNNNFEVKSLKKFKKVMAYVVGSMVIAGTSAYLAMPKEARQNLKDMVGNLTKKKCDSFCSCDDCDCDI